MILELWSQSEDGYGSIVEEDDIKQRVFLEKHMLIEGIDVSEVDILNAHYIKELSIKNGTFDNMDFLMNLSRDWFNLTPYNNRYLELSECIVFNHSNNMFESLIDTYLGSAERYIDSYDEEGNPIILSEFEFIIRKKFSIIEGVQIKAETFKEEYLYRIDECDNDLYIKSDFTVGIKKGIILGKSAVNSLLSDKSYDIIKYS